MLLITCPHCGPRDEDEFACGGESHITRPTPAAAASDDQWADYLFFRRNVRGVGYERWLHRYGCGQWFNVVRDTLTHVASSSYAMGDPAPELK